MIRFEESIGEKFEYFYHLLYSVYSLPNIVLPLLGGILIYKYGYRPMFLMFGFCVLCGQFIFALGCSTKSPILMLGGRIVFGFGGESLNTTQFSLIVEWFAANEIALALGLCLSFARLGNVFNDIISPRIATTGDVCSAMWLGFAICSISFICTILLVYLDWRQDILIQMREIVTSSNSIVMNEKKEEESLSALGKLSKRFYIMALYCMCMYGGILPFNYIAASFLIKTWYKNKITPEIQHQVGMAMALPFFVSTFLIPFIGLLVDKYGKRGYLLILSSILGLVTYICFLTTTPIFSLLLLGFTYSIFASVFWPCLSLIVPSQIIGIAYGFATSLQNFGLVIFPMIIAYIYTKSKSYEITLLFFITILTISCVLAIYMQVKDFKGDNILNRIIKEEPQKDANKFISRNQQPFSNSQTKPNDNEADVEVGGKNEEDVRLIKIQDLI